MFSLINGAHFSFVRASLFLSSENKLASFGLSFGRSRSAMRVMVVTRESCSLRNHVHRCVAFKTRAIIELANCYNRKPIETTGGRFFTASEAQKLDSQDISRSAGTRRQTERDYVKACVTTEVKAESRNRQTGGTCQDVARDQWPITSTSLCSLWRARGWLKVLLDHHSHCS